jgi:hypothetical protein
MATTKTKSQGKSAFIKEVLFDNPLANTKVVNEAWKAAGMEGAISDTLVTQMRSELGLAGNLRKGPKAASATGTAKAANAKKAAKPGRAATEAKGKAEPKPRHAVPVRDRALEEVERDIDRLIFKLMGVGGLVEIEDGLRRIRRQVVRRHQA